MPLACPRELPILVFFHAAHDEVGGAEAQLLAFIREYVASCFGAIQRRG